MPRLVRLLAALILASVLASACSRDDSTRTDTAVLMVEAEDGPVATTWTGDLDGMVERRVIRALVAYSRTHFFLDEAIPKGLTHDALVAFENSLNKRLGSGVLRVRVVAIPVPRDQLLPMLIDGRGDIAAANLTITPERRKVVDFSDPLMKNVSEFVVTHSDGPALAGLDALAGKTIHVRRSSSYAESLVTLNLRFDAEGLAPVRIRYEDEHLEDEDLLQMVGAKLIPRTIVDGHKAALWEGVLPNLQVHEDVAVRRGGQIAWAFRKNSPELKNAIDAFVARHRKGTLLGNLALKRYLKNSNYVREWLEANESKKTTKVSRVIRQYAEEYDFDWRLITAQAYQESRLDHSAVSPAGAVGLMQLLPTTAADPNIGIDGIDELENNVHAGVKYLRFLMDRYFSDDDIDPIDRRLFALAAYNAGPRRVAGLRRRAQQKGLDPNKWFDNVERIAAREIGRETVNYVSQIYKAYLVYRRIDQIERAKRLVTL